MQGATEDFFKAVTQYAHEVPIIVVATRKDEFLSMKRGECSMQRSVSRSMDECIIDAKNQLVERINQIVRDIAHVEKGQLHEWVAVSEGEPSCMLNTFQNANSMQLPTWIYAKELNSIVTAIFIWP